MAIILRKKINEIHPEQAEIFKKDLPKIDKIGIVRYVKSENLYYIFNGISWQEIDLIVE
jgi:hypothetical protein